jgi:two-component system CheB/CheR fusion protein
MSADPEQTRALSGTSLVPVVAIGVSAGGIQALQTFFEAMPAKTGAAFVVILHLDPEHRSDLSSILAARTAMAVTQVQNRTPIEPNHIYVIPPNRQLTVCDGSLDTCEFKEERGRRAPIDHFFRSLADKLGDGFAVILTGAGSDGSVGIKAIKEAGGLIFVQDPNEAEYSSMPRSAIATGCADAVLPLGGLAERIAALIPIKQRFQDGKALETEEDVIRAILTYLNTRKGHDFSKYKRPTVLRRLARRMEVKQIPELSAYLNYLRENPEEIQALFGDFLISVTTFFRDPAAFDALENLVIPKLFEGKESSSIIRAWVPGCATGEEAYSIAMLLLEEASRRNPQPQIQVFATDIDSGALATAREGLYPIAIEADVSEERLSRFFTQDKEHYHVKRELRDSVLFALHNLANDPPFSRMHLISCRNMLIYFDRDLQRQACGIFNYALVPGGYLFLGQSETADSAGDAFGIVDKDARIYQSAGRLPQSALPPLRGFGTARLDALHSPAASARAATANDGAAHKQALEDFAPPSILVDGAYRILHLSESAGRYLRVPGGPPTSNISELVRPELRLDVLTALSKVFKRQRSSLTAPVLVTFNGTEAQVHLQVRPVMRKNAPPAALIFFMEASEDDVRAADLRSFSSAELRSDHATRALAEELESTKTLLHTSRQEYETAIEDLRAANEEMQSVGEEYRSTAEELETSKEELQSINEELQATNQELNLKVATISRAHNDLQNLISVSDVGTLFLDKDLRIRRITPKVADLLNITVNDEGQPISDFTHRLVNHPGLREDAREVLADLSPRECEVRSDAGRWYLLRMRPYRTIEDKIEGVVITFVDITARRQTENDLLESERRLQLAREANALGIIDYNAEANELWFDARCRQLWGLGEADPVTLDVFFAGIAESDRPKVQQALSQALDPAGNGAFCVEFRMAGKRQDQWLRALGRAFFTGAGKPSRWPRLVAILQDVSEAKAWDSHQSVLIGELSHRVKNTLAVIMAMVRQTLHDATEPEAMKKFEDRLFALSAAHDLLVKSGWKGAEIGVIVKRLLAVYPAFDQGRVTIEGPELVLSTHLTTAFVMILHELATNAAKYGALGENGCVAVTWRIVLPHTGRLLELVWQESGGPPVPANRGSGFGTFIIENGMSDAKVERRFEPDGLVCRIEVQL